MFFCFLFSVFFMPNVFPFSVLFGCFFAFGINLSLWLTILYKYHGDLGENLKVCKGFLRKLKKCMNFADFSKTFKSHSLNFRAVGRKKLLSWKVLRKFENFLKKIAKFYYFRLFLIQFSKPCVNFSLVWTKNTNSWEILRKCWNFDKNSIVKLQF